MTCYVIAPGSEPQSWVLTSTSEKEQPKRKMNFEGDEELLEFLRGVMAEGGRVVVEIPHSASEDPERARNAAGRNE